MESLLFVTERDGHRTLCLLPILTSSAVSWSCSRHESVKGRATGDTDTDAKQRPKREHYGLMMERVGEDCAFRLVRLADVRTVGARSLTDGPVAGCLGILRRAGEDFVCVITKCSLVADLSCQTTASNDHSSGGNSDCDGGGNSDCNGGGSSNNNNEKENVSSNNVTRRIWRIERVAFFGITSDKYDNYSTRAAAKTAGGGNRTAAETHLHHSPALQGDLNSAADGYYYDEYDDPTADIAAYLSSGYFYFSYDHDLTQSVQREEQDSRHSWRTCSAMFFWNAFLLEPVREFAEGLGEEHLQFVEHGGMFVVAMQGFVQAATIPYYTLSHRPSSCSLSIAVISRLSCHRAGTRFRARGIDDDGHVANFVETEVVLQDGPLLFSYIVLRGSVPVFWDQQGLQFGRPTFQITRNATATQPAFDRHFDRLVRQYGLVHCLDLLGQKTGGAEHFLSSAFKLHAERYPGYPDTVSLTQFDVNAVCRGEDLDRVGSIMPSISQDVQIFSHYYATSPNTAPLKTQKGVFRVNCQDCLDRTNIVQGFVTKSVVELFVRQNLITSDRQLDMLRLSNTLSELWANNGDALSMIYTGTGALRSGFTRSGRRTFAGLMDDVRKTAQRFYVNNFQDKGRQVAVDVLLGKQADQERVAVFNPVSKAVLRELTERIGEYSQMGSIRVLAVTWNCNGATPRNAYDTNCLLELITCHDHTIVDSNYGTWPPSPSSSGHHHHHHHHNHHHRHQPPEMLAISFQEIVELSATQIMSVDPERRLEWEAFIQKALKGISSDESQHYSLLVSNQLVGTSVSLFVRSQCIPFIRGVEIGSIKTGLGGMAGNKGSVGIRLDYHDTSLCFLASHFTAGQQYVTERNREYFYIAHNLVFSKGRTVESHDAIIWMGDFNYRLDMSFEEANELIRDRRYEELLHADQLTRSRQHGAAFSGFIEAPITFPPTYKYDLHSSNYDTSEKMRTPSYCDRVMTKGEDVEVMWYGRAGSIDLSDHRPVKALVKVPVRRLDKERLEELQAELFGKFTCCQIQSPCEGIPIDDHVAGDANDGRGSNKTRSEGPSVIDAPAQRLLNEDANPDLGKETADTAGEQPAATIGSSTVDNDLFHYQTEPLSECEKEQPIHRPPETPARLPAATPPAEEDQSSTASITERIRQLELVSAPHSSGGSGSVGNLVVPGTVHSHVRRLKDDEHPTRRSPKKPPKPALHPVTPGSEDSSAENCDDNNDGSDNGA